MIFIERYDEDNELIRPGLRKSVPHQLSSPKFSIFTTLESVDPDVWRVEVVFLDTIIISLDEGFPEKFAAAKAAEAELRERLLRLFR